MVTSRKSLKDISEGTRRIYQLDPRGIGAMREWLERFWTDALQNFAKFVDQQERDSE